MNGPLAEQLEHETQGAQWLSDLGVRDAKRGLANLKQIASTGISGSQFELLLAQLQQHLPNLSDADRALNNLERFAAQSPETLPAIIDSDDTALADLLTVLATSQHLSDLLIRDPRNYQTIWQAKGQLVSCDRLVETLTNRIAAASAMETAMMELRRFKHQETIRIAVGDLIVGQRVDQVAEQISFVAIAVVEAAYQFARRHLAEKHGQPLTPDGSHGRFVVLAMGKLGGMELNYSSDIDLVMVYDENGMTAGGTKLGGRKISNQEFFGSVCRLMVKLIGQSTELGAAYRVDLRLRPNGTSGKICSSYQSMTQYYDLQGRTWERQALVKASAIAGDCDLGRRLLSELSPWIYRRNLSRADISGIKALKRKIERRALVAGEDRTNVKTGHGGIRDVEFIIQFMQLLNGGELPEIRTTNTLEAIRRLERTKCLSPAESTLLAQNYAWLRKLEHRLQMMDDLQTHTIPDGDDERRKIAIRMGCHDDESSQALDQFEQILNESTESNRKILNHLLHGSFGMAFGSLRDTGGQEYRIDEQEVPLEVDLILDPEPDSEMVESVLRPYGFQNVHAAFSNLMDLAAETTPFLSSRRCKHFLASVAPALLHALSQTPDPDASLTTLATVSDCLGAKGVLWELSSFNPPTLNLYVRLCASSDYLVGILKSNPGMIDELADALQLGELPSFQWQSAVMDELSKGADDLAPIVRSFKNTQHMRVGIRDILGRDDVRDTHLALSDIAEICVRTATSREYEKMCDKYVQPKYRQSVKDMDCPLVILGLGKLGGREPNYHSDLDIIFLYDTRGDSESTFRRSLTDGISSQFFFSELAAAITQFFADGAGVGRLYEIDSRLRPTGKSGSLAVSMDEFKRYFESGQGQLWERQALCKSRPILGMRASDQKAMQLVHEAITTVTWRPEMAREIRSMRLAMQKDCSFRNLKRGEGGTVDVEFVIQMLQLRHAREDRWILVPGTLEAIERLVDRGYLTAPRGSQLADGYQALRSVESRLRLMNTTARHDLPADARQLAKLAYLLNYADPKQMTESITQHRQSIRAILDELTAT